MVNPRYSVRHLEYLATDSINNRLVIAVHMYFQITWLGKFVYFILKYILLK